METLTICRFCLNDNVQHVVKNLHLQETYERLTRIPFQSDMRPLAVCYICYAQLRASHRFMLKCLQAEQLLAQMLDQQPALNPTQIDRSAFDQLSIRSTELTVIESTVHGFHTSDTDKLNTYEFNVKERLSITDLTDTEQNPSDSEQNPSDLEDNKPLNYIKKIRKTKEIRVVEQQQDRLMTVCPKTEECESNRVANYIQDIINVTNTDGIKIEASEHNDDFENCKIEMITEQDSIIRDTYPQYVRERYTNSIKYNDNAINDSLNGDKTCLSSENIFICDKCKNSFSKKNELVKHMPKCDKSHMCPVCNKGFTKMYYLKIHALMHTGEKPYVCNVCQKGYIRKSHLKRHKLTHTDAKPFVCNMCPKGFHEKSLLKTHILIHTGEKPHVCNVCQKGYTVKASLEQHKRTHAGEKPFVCNVCQKGFFHKTDLKRHKLTHTGVKPFVCNVCQKGFLQKATLNTHILVHAEEKPHVCNVCQKGFTLKGSLEKHKLKHTGEKPFVCSVCQKGFIQRFDLKRHSYTHRGETT